MGLDVNLCWFKDLDTEAVLALSRFASEPWAFEAGAEQKLKAKARELGLREDVVGANYFGGEGISFPSKLHPEWPRVGNWTSFSGTRTFMERSTGRGIYYVFPEAVGEPTYFRPDWAGSRKRLKNIVTEIQSQKPEQVKVLLQGMPDHVFATYVAQLEVMIETLDYVLSHEKPREFLLRWSA